MANRNKNKPVFFSLLTAALNSQETIKRTIESISNQVFKDFEHIIIDGGSNDNTCKIIKSYESRYNLTWVSEPDEGIADALNKGLKRATGRYIIIIQTDDSLLEPCTLENVYALLKNETVDIYSSPIILNHPKRGRILRKPVRSLWWNHFKFIFLHQGCFVHRRVFDVVGGFRKEFKINMDYDFFYRALKHRCRIQFGNFPVALMGGSGIGSRSDYAFQRLREERLVQRLNERNPIWKTMQMMFGLLYMPYKKHVLSKIHGFSHDRYKPSF